MALDHLRSYHTSQETSFDNYQTGFLNMSNEKFQMSQQDIRNMNLNKMSRDLKGQNFLQYETVGITTGYTNENSANKPETNSEKHEVSQFTLV